MGFLNECVIANTLIETLSFWKRAKACCHPLTLNTTVESDGPKIPIDRIDLALASTLGLLSYRYQFMLNRQCVFLGYEIQSVSFRRRNFDAVIIAGGVEPPVATSGLMKYLLRLFRTAPSVHSCFPLCEHRLEVAENGIVHRLLQARAGARRSAGELVKDSAEDQEGNLPVVGRFRARERG